MNSNKQKQVKDKLASIQKDLVALVQILADIDEANPSSDINEISFVAEDGETVQLSVNETDNDRSVTVTSKDLKLTLGLDNDNVRSKRKSN